MPVTVVVGGQFGSEGKGKVALWFGREQGAAAAIRIGGSNSGHTAYDEAGNRHIFRHLPTAALLPDVKCILGAGSYIDTDVLLEEINRIQLPKSRLLIDPAAVIVTEADKDFEREHGFRSAVGSTLSGTGAALLRRIQRDRTIRFASDCEPLKQYVAPTRSALRTMLSNGQRIVLEGTQGFGLSILHGGHYPFATSRDTSASGFLSEAGLSPRDVDEVVLVIRTFPIRVPGNSGPLPYEIDWPTVTRECGAQTPIEEFTSVTKTSRRVARFDAEVVKQAIEANQPTSIVLNHLDYVDRDVSERKELSPKALRFLRSVENSIAARIEFYGQSLTALQATPPEKTA